MRTVYMKMLNNNIRTNSTLGVSDTKIIICSEISEYKIANRDLISHCFPLYWAPVTKLTGFIPSEAQIPVPHYNFEQDKFGILLEEWIKIEHRSTEGGPSSVIYRPWKSTSFWIYIDIIMSPVLLNLSSVRPRLQLNRLGFSKITVRSKGPINTFC